MRNVTSDAPYPAEPNRADTQAAQTLINLHTYRPALPKLLKIDREGTDALKQLPPDLPRIDLMIDRHLGNLQWARGALGDLLRAGTVGQADKAAAVAVYRRAVDTSFTDDRGCVHGFTASFDTRMYLAALYLYGNGTAPDRAEARRLMQGDDSANAKAIVAAIDRNQLPGQYLDFLRLARTELKEPGPTIHDLQNEEPSPWTGYLIAVLTVALIGIVIVVAIIRARPAANDPNGRKGSSGLFETLRTAFGRLDLLFKGLMAFGVGCSGLYWLLSASLVSYQPWYFQWLDYALVGGMIVAIGHGVFTVVAALRADRRANHGQVHGDARPASQEEAMKAARHRRRPKSGRPGIQGLNGFDGR